MNQCDVVVVFEEGQRRSAAYVDGVQVGECEFGVSDGRWVIEHTGVRSEYGGRGIARRLVERVIDEARVRGVKVGAECSCARRVMEDEGYGDVYDDGVC